MISRGRMVRGLVSLAAAGGLFLASSNCCMPRANREYIEGYQDAVTETETASLEHLVSSTYCLDTQLLYQDEEGNHITPGGYGTGFGYRKVDGYHYLLTNQHVLGHMEHEVGLVKFKRLHSRVKIIDSRFDEYEEDDISLEIVFESSDLDLAIIRTESEINLLPENRYADSSTLKFGEEVYLVGYPMGLFPVVTKGIVANPGNFVEDEDSIFKDEKNQITIPASAKKILDLSINPGNSGSPFFVKRDGVLYWAGIANAYVADEAKRNTGLAVTMGSTYIRQIADYVITNAESFIAERRSLEDVELLRCE